MAIFHIDGFNHGIVTSDGDVAANFGSVVGAPTTDASPVYGGAGRSLGFPGSGRYVRWDQNDVVVPSTTETAITIQFKVNFTTLPSTNELQLLKIWTGSPFYENWIYVTSGGAMASKYWGSPPTDDSGTNSYSLSTSTWYTVDVGIDVSTGTWTFDWQITPTGGSPTTMTQRTVSNTGGEIGTVVLGWIDSNANTADFNIDDLIVSNAGADYPLADQYHITGFSPNGVGTHNIDVGSGSSAYFYTNSGALVLPDTTSYQRLDEVPMGGSTGYVGIQPGTSSGTDTNVPPRPIDALAISNLNESAATVRANIDEDPDSPDGLWATATSNNVNTNARLRFPAMSGGPASSGTMVTKGYVRLTSGSGSGTPTARIDLYYNGSLVATGSENNVTSSSGQLITQNFDMATVGSSLGDASLIELDIVGSRSGGGPSARSAVDFGAIEVSSFPWENTVEPTNTWYTEHTFADNSDTDTIVGVQARITGKADAAGGTNTTVYKLRADGADGDIFNGSIATSSIVDRTKYFSQTPNSTAWDDTKFDATTIRFGYTADATPHCQFHAAHLEALFQASGNQTVTPGGISSASSIGSPTMSPGNVNVSPSGLASASSLGTVTWSANYDLAVSGIASASSIGAVTPVEGNVNVPVSGIGSASSIGTVTVIGSQEVPVSGIASSSSIGTPTFATGNVNVPVSGISSASSFGTVTWTGNYDLAVSGIASASDIGVPTVVGAQEVPVSGIASAQSFGTVTITTGNVNVPVSGLASASSLGAVTITTGNVNVSVSGIASASSIGAATGVEGNVNVPVSGLASASSIGTVTYSTGNVNVPVSGLASASSIGAATASTGGSPQTVDMTGLGLASASSLGTVTYTTGNVNVPVSGIASASSIGTVTYTATVDVPVSGLASASNIGTITYTTGGVTIPVAGLASAAAFGAITTLGGDLPDWSPAIHGGAPYRR